MELLDDEVVAVILSKLGVWDQQEIRLVFTSFRRALPVQLLNLDVRSWSTSDARLLARILRSGMRVLVTAHVELVPQWIKALQRLLDVICQGPQLAGLVIRLQWTASTQQEATQKEPAEGAHVEGAAEQEQEQDMGADLVQVLSTCTHPFELQLLSKQHAEAQAAPGALAMQHASAALVGQGNSSLAGSPGLAKGRWLLPQHLSALTEGRLTGFHCHHLLALSELQVLAQQHAGLRAISVAVKSRQASLGLPGGDTSFAAGPDADQPGGLLQAALDAVVGLQQLQQLALDVIDTRRPALRITAVLPAQLAGRLRSLSVAIHHGDNSARATQRGRRQLLLNVCSKLRSLCLAQVQLMLSQGDELAELHELQLRYGGELQVAAAGGLLQLGQVTHLVQVAQGWTRFHQWWGRLPAVQFRRLLQASPALKEFHVDGLSTCKGLLALLEALPDHLTVLAITEASHLTLEGDSARKEREEALQGVLEEGRAPGRAQLRQEEQAEWLQLSSACWQQLARFRQLRALHLQLSRERWAHALPLSKASNEVLAGLTCLQQLSGCFTGLDVACLPQRLTVLHLQACDEQPLVDSCMQLAVQLEQDAQKLADAQWQQQQGAALLQEGLQRGQQGRVLLGQHMQAQGAALEAELVPVVQQRRELMQQRGWRQAKLRELVLGWVGSKEASRPQDDSGLRYPRAYHQRMQECGGREKADPPDGWGRQLLHSLMPVLSQLLSLRMECDAAPAAGGMYDMHVLLEQLHTLTRMAVARPWEGMAWELRRLRWLRKVVVARGQLQAEEAAQLAQQLPGLVVQLGGW